MKHKRYISLFFLNLTFVTISICQSKFITELDKCVKPLYSDFDNKTIKEENLKPFFTKGKIYALGEAAHIAREFFIVKKEIIKYLVTKLDYKIIVFEADFAGTMAMNNYLSSKSDDLMNNLQKMGFGMFFIQEFVELLNWLKEYNTSVLENEKVKVYGCDMQFHNVVLNKLNDIVKQESEFGNEKKVEWDKFYETVLSKGYKKYSKDERAYVNNFIQGFEKTYNELCNNNLLKYYLSVLKQNISYKFRTGGFSSSVIRDKFMAENIKWVIDFEKTTDVIVWAHNGHIAKKTDQTKRTTMGHYLHEIYNDKYIACGFGFNEGNLKAYNPQTRKFQGYDIYPSQLKKSYDSFFSKSK